ncbi:unnamed protein product [Ceratitis capitata]|uniref:(Mediterranean fruit fly) hypothetical protein n=1 Tax=Ceratitis capitata TaxID=7213 RepID=A0A811UB84_CERCA|nr:unnamed protein product [Ceratitis capitata]
MVKIVKKKDIEHNVLYLLRYVRIYEYDTLDRFQRLGFGRKSTPASSSASTESSGSSRNRKSNEKSEKLRELTELLRGNRSSPTPPPIPPPRKPRSGSHSASNSLERADTQVQVPAGSSSFDGAGQSNSFMSSRIDDIMLMDHEEKVTDLHVKPNVNTKQSNDNDFAKQSNNVCGKSNACTTVGKAENREHSIAQTNLLRDTLKPNTSLSNFESLMLMSREKSKSPPPKSSANIGASSSVNVGVAQLADSSDIATKLTRPESRTVIGSYTQRAYHFDRHHFLKLTFRLGNTKNLRGVHCVIVCGETKLLALSIQQPTRRKRVVSKRRKLGLLQWESKGK